MKAPAFQWYPGDYLGSQRVALLSLEEEGAYFRLINYCWIHGSIPADPQRLARLIGKGASTTLASSVATMFEPRGEVLIHTRLEEERKKQIEWREKSSAGGKKSAAIREQVRKGKGASTTLEPPNKGSRSEGPKQKATLLSAPSSLSSGEREEGAELATTEEAVAALATLGGGTGRRLGLTKVIEGGCPS